MRSLDVALADELAAAARAFRLGLEERGHAALARLADALSGRLAVPAAAALLAELAPLLGALVAAQERGDALAIADTLEFRLAPRLASEPGEGSGPSLRGGAGPGEAS
jgi:hypothetical protein